MSSLSLSEFSYRNSEFSSWISFRATVQPFHRLCAWSLVCLQAEQLLYHALLLNVTDKCVHHRCMLNFDLYSVFSFDDFMLSFISDHA